MATVTPCDNLFIGGLPTDITQERINEVFGAYGTVLDVKVMPARVPQGKSSAFVRFSTVEEAQWFQENVNGNCPQGLDAPITVAYKNNNKGAGKGFGAAGGNGAIKGTAGAQMSAGAGAQWGAKGGWKGGGGGGGGAGAAGGKTWGTPDGSPNDTVHIGDMPPETDDALVQSIFGKYGNVTWHKAFPPKHPGGKASCLVQFDSVDEAKWLVDNVNGNCPEGLAAPISVKFKSSQGSWGSRGGMGGASADGPYGGKGGGKNGASDIAVVIKGISKGRAKTPDENQLRVTGLPANTTDVDLYKLFAPLGAVTAVKAMVSPDGACTGLGWVDYSDVNEAEAAINTLNGMILPDGTTLGVAQKRPGGGGKGKGK